MITMGTSKRKIWDKSISRGRAWCPPVLFSLKILLFYRINAFGYLEYAHGQFYSELLIGTGGNRSDRQEEIQHDKYA
jgi:hypothetical protein